MNANKLIWAILGALFLAGKNFLDDGSIANDEALLLTVAGLGAVEVWLVPNTTLLATVKTWVHAIMMGLGALVLALAGGVTGAEWIDVAIMIGTTAGVFGIPNQDKRQPVGVVDSSVQRVA